MGRCHLLALGPRKHRCGSPELVGTDAALEAARPRPTALANSLLPQAHIYSLGATLKAALEYVTEPEAEPKLSQDLEALLGQMQAEDPRDRPDLQVSGKANP